LAKKPDLQLESPIAVFDAGIGSYAIVDLIRRKLPRQDILYFADRASFPYGHKSRDALLAIIVRTFNLLKNWNPSAIVIASNVPTIMLMDELKAMAGLPVFGVFPPLAEALAASKTGKVGIMGVRSMIESIQLADFVKRFTGRPENVALINASPMVDLVESGAFLFDPIGTMQKVNKFIETLFDRYPEIDGLTLSSTHLPWLSTYFVSARPDCRFLDPAETIIHGIGEGNAGSGTILGLVTENQDYPVSDFQAMLLKLQISIPLQVVVLPA
jgi:glutamate racemase